MFGDIIDIQIKSLQGIKISILKKSPQWIFAKGLTHDFGKKKKKWEIHALHFLCQNTLKNDVW